MSDIAALGQEAAPHLSCVGSTREGISEILATYRAQKIRRLVALRGDLPSGTATAGEFRYASELIAFIRETQGSDWFIEVAAYPEYHPQERYAKRDLQHFAAKVKAGADSAITQFFFNPDAYFHFVDEVRALGVEVPIVPGIMPFHNYAKIAQFAARDGIEIPRWVALKMEGFMDDTASIRAFGLDVVTRLCAAADRRRRARAALLHAEPVGADARDLQATRRRLRRTSERAAQGRCHITPSSVRSASSGRSSGEERRNGRKPCVKLTPTVTGRGFSARRVRSKKPPP